MERIFYTRCGHYCERVVRCPLYHAFDCNHRQDPNKRSGIKKFFNAISFQDDNSPRPVRVRTRVEICPWCLAQPEMVQQIEQKEQRERERLQKLQLEDERRTDRLMFVCSDCRCYGVPDEPWDRNHIVNRGLCCENGLLEYPEREERLWPGHPTNDRRALDSAQAESSTQAARAAAREASARYGWDDDDRGSADLNPRLVSDFVGLPGVTTDYLPMPRGLYEERRQYEERRPYGERRPYEERRLYEERHPYEEPGIDWDRWEQSPQTFHGRYPPAEPAPERPLPSPPRGSRVADGANNPRSRSASGGVVNQRVSQHALRRKPVPSRERSRTAVHRSPLSPIARPVPDRDLVPQPLFADITSRRRGSRGHAAGFEGHRSPPRSPSSGSRGVNWSPPSSGRDFAPNRARRSAPFNVENELDETIETWNRM